jgi:hypothetical protein
LREQNDLNWARVEARIGQVETSLRSEFNQGLAGLRSDLDVGLERLRSDLLKWMFLFWTGTALTAIKVWVNGQPFSGDPRSIPLTAHADVVVQVGAPRQAGPGR